MGHKDIKMTLRYAHLAPSHKANSVSKLENIFESVQKVYNMEEYKNADIA